MDNAQRFVGKTALVTGAASGIGRATAMAFGSEGAQVALVDRSGEALEQLCREMEAAGVTALAVRCDIAVPDEVEAAVRKTVERFGRLDCAFNNAATDSRISPVHETELDDWDRVMAVNLRGTFVCMKYELAQMVRQGSGVVVNTSSGAGIKGIPGGAPYVASKHALIGLTRSAALEYAGMNIRVNAVLPGNIDTPMLHRSTGGDSEKAIQYEPVGRLGKPEEIAEAVLWMCSDLGGFVTGAATVVDGGWSL